MGSTRENASAAATGRKRGARPLLFVTSCALLGLCGCAARQMKSDFTGFESAYAETSNREVLLNLARLGNHDPTYFFKLGQISTSYRMQAGLTGFGNYVPQGTTPGGSNVTGGGTPAIAYESNPAFTFIPVNDDTNAQLLLKPIPPETFYVLFQQGWRLDQLFRLMVDRIELTTSDGKRCITETIRNSPDASNLGDYVRFLRASAILYSLQKGGFLLLRGDNTFVAFDRKSLLPEPANAQTDQGGSKKSPSQEPANTQTNGGTQGSEKAAATMTAKDFNDAWAKNSVWEQVREEGDDNGKWRLGQEVFNPVFLLNPPFVDCNDLDASKKISPDDKLCPNMKAIEDEIKQDKDMYQKLHPVDGLLAVVLEGLVNGFSIEGSELPSIKLPCQSPDASMSAGILKIHLVMRSLIGVMAAAAQEQDRFDALLKSTAPVPPDPLLNPNEQKGLTFETAVPQVEQLPLLRLKWAPEDGEPMPSLIPPLNYRGNIYIVADQSNPSVPENQYWNRDMFRLISELSAQVTVDISKFPLPEVLQLRTQ
jgi:hypothetical protein